MLVLLLRSGSHATYVGSLLAEKPAAMRLLPLVVGEHGETVLQNQVILAVQLHVGKGHWQQVFMVYIHLTD